MKIINENKNILLCTAYSKYMHIYLIFAYQVFDKAV